MPPSPRPPSHVKDLRLGTMFPGHEVGPKLAAILQHGFESFELTWGWGKDCRNWDLGRSAAEVQKSLSGSKAVISAVGFYWNPLKTDDDGKVARDSLAQLIERVKDFGTDVVCGFTGCVDGTPIPDQIPRFVEVWKPLVELAAKHQVKIAFENCPMGGTWRSPRYNLAVNPDAWELLFQGLGDPAHVGLEWEPCHQMCQLIEPIPQIRQWGHRFYHIHGKDANVAWDVVRRQGINGKDAFCWHRTPGFGDSDWTLIIGELLRTGFKGSIDIEGWHDPIWKGDMEMTGQVHGLNYLKRCRPTYVAN